MLLLVLVAAVCFCVLQLYRGFRADGGKQNTESADIAPPTCRTNWNRDYYHDGKRWRRKRYN